MGGSDWEVYDVETRDNSFDDDRTRGRYKPSGAGPLHGYDAIMKYIEQRRPKWFGWFWKSNIIHCYQGHKKPTVELKFGDKREYCMLLFGPRDDVCKGIKSAKEFVQEMKRLHPVSKNFHKHFGTKPRPGTGTCTGTPRCTHKPRENNNNYVFPEL